MKEKQPVEDIAQETPKQFFGVEIRKDRISVFANRVVELSLPSLSHKAKLTNVFVLFYQTT